MTPVAQALSTALLHFLWQGIAVGVLLAIALLLLRKSSASSRYVASCIVLAMLALAPVVTGWVVYQSPQDSAAQSAAEAASAPPVVVGVSTVEPAAPATTGVLATWILPVWAAGVLVFALRLAWAGGHASSLRRHGVPADSAIQSMIQMLAKRAGIRRTIHVLMSSLSEVPSVVGWLRPVILLPAAVVVGLTPLQLEALVAHELAHIRRHDYFVNILQMIVETLLFYHPAVWWVSSRIRYERELCCDDLAVRSCGDAISYARALAQLERLRTTGPTLAMGSADGTLFHRIQRLLGRGGVEFGPSKLMCAMGLLVGVFSLALFMSNARAQQEQAAPPVTQEFGLPAQAVPAVLPIPPQPAPPPSSALQSLPVMPEPAPAPLAPLALPTSPVAPASIAPLAVAPVTSRPSMPSAAPAVPQIVAPTAPAPPGAPVSPTPPVAVAPVALQTANRVPWVLFRGDGMHARDTTAAEVEAARRARQSFTGNLLWFQLDGKAFVTQDPETINQVLASAGSREAEAKLSGALAQLAVSQAMLDRNRALRGAQQNLQELNDRLNRVSPSPDTAQSLDQARRQLDALSQENMRLQAMMHQLEAQLRLMEKDTQWESDTARDLEVLRGAVRSGRAQAVP
jgi:beta-lactamase regulating signal transducer with metallopeptidase domain